MKKLKFIVISKRKIIYAILVSIIVLLIIKMCLVNSKDFMLDAYSYICPSVVIDAGHGGIDGGAAIDNILEKDINLKISKKLKTCLEKSGYRVIMTRDEDISLEKFSNSTSSRHQRDLNARVNIINNSDANLFLSIHTDCNLKNPEMDGSIVIYNNSSSVSKGLALCIQRSLNNIEIDGNKRIVHDPKEGKFFILGYSKIPGVIIETGFMSNRRERELLLDEKFNETIAQTIALGVGQYFKE